VEKRAKKVEHAVSGGHDDDDGGGSGGDKKRAERGAPNAGARSRKQKA